MDRMTRRHHRHNFTYQPVSVLCDACARNAYKAWDVYHCTCHNWPNRARGFAAHRAFRSWAHTATTHARLARAHTLFHQKAPRNRAWATWKRLLKFSLADAVARHIALDALHTWLGQCARLARSERLAEARRAFRGWLLLAHAQRMQRHAAVTVFLSRARIAEGDTQRRAWARWNVLRLEKRLRRAERAQQLAETAHASQVHGVRTDADKYAREAAELRYDLELLRGATARRLDGGAASFFARRRLPSAWVHWKLRTPRLPRAPPPRARAHR